MFSDFKKKGGIIISSQELQVLSDWLTENIKLSEDKLHNIENKLSSNKNKRKMAYLEGRVNTLTEVNELVKFAQLAEDTKPVYREPLVTNKDTSRSFALSEDPRSNVKNCIVCGNPLSPHDFAYDKLCSARCREIHRDRIERSTVRQ